MIVKGHELSNCMTLESDVVVVGAGPAGIVTALELGAAGLGVILLESGGKKPDPRIQQLSDSVLVDDRRHSPSSIIARRQIGGTSVIWGGRCVPFDPIDFDARDYISSSRWPVSYEQVQPYFQRACDWLVCGRAVFDANEVPALRDTPLVPGLVDDTVRTSSLERWSLPTNFGREYRRQLLESRRVRLLSSVTCTEIVCSNTEPSVQHLNARTMEGRQITVRAAKYVLACGGLETTRLLLASQTPAGPAIGDHSGHLGRWYMAHVEGSIADVRFVTPPSATQYSYARDVDGVYVRRRLSFAREHLMKQRLPNIVSWLANPELADPAHGSGALSFAYLALASPAGKWLAPEAQRRSLTGNYTPGTPYGIANKGPTSMHLRNMLRDFGATEQFIIGFGLHRFLPRRRAPGFFVFRPANTYPLQYHGEHRPRRDSRVTLADERDIFGMPKLRIDLRFSQSDVEGVIRAHELWDGYLRRHGVGTLAYRSTDAESAVWERIGGGFHQAGTTRMSLRPEDGVVDPNLVVHGTDNLFVVSSSTFVTSGQANSTFMIVVFALRLVDHLRQLFSR